MAEQITLSGTLTGSPATVTDSTFPSGTVDLSFSTQKTFNAAAGPGPLNVNSPGAYVAVPGIGAAPALAQAQLLYGRVTSPMRFRLTFAGDDPAPKVMYVGGLFFVECDPSRPIILFEVMGSGQLEFYATGSQ